MRRIGKGGWAFLGLALLLGVLVLPSGLLKRKTPASSSVATESQLLKPYTVCKPENGLEIASVDRLPGSGTRHRTVETVAGRKAVSMIDGYRVMFAYRDESFFANLKVETSAESEYVNDRDAIVAHLEHMAKGAGVARKRYASFDAYSIDQPTIDAPGPLGIHVLFRDASQTVVTIYFLNQEPSRRHFQSLQEYEVLRDAFLHDYVACMEKS